MLVSRKVRVSVCWLSAIACCGQATAQSGPSAAELFRGADVALGERLIKEHRCVECHRQKVGGDGSTIYRPAGRISTPGFLRGNELATLAAIAKCHASDTAMRVATDAVQLFGAAGISNEMPINRYFRDAKVLQIVEGTNQIQRNIIARNLMGKG